MGGHYHHSKKKNKGPQLPGSLLKEIGGSGVTSQSKHGVFRKKGAGKRKRGVEQPTTRALPGKNVVKEKVPEGHKSDGKERSTKNGKKPRQDKTNSTSREGGEDPERILQKQLAKKLGMKSTTLKKNEDGLDDLLNELDDIMMGNDGESSFEEESEAEEEFSIPTSSSLGGDASDESLSDGIDEENIVLDKVKYVPPALRNKKSDVNDEQEAAVCRRVRGLVNRITESNMEGIVKELCNMYENEGRSYVSRSLSHELVSASMEGPRASEKFAIVAAACIASVGGLTKSSEVVATFLSLLGQNLEIALKKNDSLACSNLVRLLGCLYLTKVVKPDLMFDILNTWGDIFSDEHIVSIAGLLTVAGLALRKSDPSLMKNFVIDIHDKASRHGEIPTRAKIMLDLVVDVKNNRMNSRQGALSISGNGSATLANVLPPNVSTWFKACKVEAVAVGGIPWSKVVSRNNKGFWWVPTIHDKFGDTLKGPSTTVAHETNEYEFDSVSNAELLKLASKLRMTTDTRKSIFLAIMGSEDAIDAAEKLLRLDLKGQQEREIVRVAIECCLQEKTWNVYYGLLLSRLCKLAKGHRVTLQYCLWDHLKDVDRMNPRMLTIFSKLCSYTIVSKILPLHTLIKIANLDVADMGTKELLLWRTFFKSVFEDASCQEEFKSLFARIAEDKELHSLKKKLKVFVKMDVGPWLAAKSTSASKEEERKLLKLLSCCNTAEKMLTK